MIIKINDWAKYDVTTLSIFNNMCGGTNSDFSASSEVYKPSSEQSRIVKDHVTPENSFGGLWIRTNLGEVVLEVGHVVELLGNMGCTGLNKFIVQDSWKAKREVKDIYGSEF